MVVRRRISATYKDLPGGQVLGPSYDYPHRLLDFALAAEDGVGEPQAACAARPVQAAVPRVPDIHNHEGPIEAQISIHAHLPGVRIRPACCRAKGFHTVDHKVAAA